MVDERKAYNKMKIKEVKLMNATFNSTGDAFSLETIEQIASELIKKTELKETVERIKRIVDPVLDKKYEVYQVQTSLGNRYMLKHIKKEQELLVYSTLFSNYDVPVPHFYGDIEGSDRSHWVFGQWVEGRELVHGDVTDYYSTVSALADLHWTMSTRSQEPSSFLDDTNNWIFDELAWINEQNKRMPFSDHLIAVLQHSALLIAQRPKTVIHNDLLPINVIISANRNATIIDWGQVAYGFYAFDLGRLLGDLRNEQGSYWVVPTLWESILSVYWKRLMEHRLFCSKGTIFDECHTFSGERRSAIENHKLVCFDQITWDELLVDFHYGRLWNYAGIVFAHWKRDWPKSRWYKINLHAMEETAEWLGKLKQPKMA